MVRQDGTWQPMRATPAFPADGLIEDVSCAGGTCLAVGGAGPDRAALRGDRPLTGGRLPC